MADICRKKNIRPVDLLLDWNSNSGLPPVGLVLIQLNYPGHRRIFSPKYLSFSQILKYGSSRLRFKNLIENIHRWLK